MACSSEEDVADYPSKTIELIVPWDAGGDTDAIYRIIGTELEKELGQTVVIKNISGGSGVIGAQEGLNAKNDGYTLIAIHDSVTMSELTGQSTFGYFDFEPVSLLTSTYDAIATSPDNPWDTMEEMINDAQETPGSITYAASIGSTSQLEPALIQVATDTEFNIVGYDGTSERMKAVVGNDVHLGSVSVTAGKDYLADNRMKLLGFTGDERSPALPDLPTLKEQGIDVVSGTNRGIVVPKDTPEEIIEVLNNALEKIANEELEQRLSELGTELNFKNTEEYIEFLKESEGSIEQALEESGLLVE